MNMGALVIGEEEKKSIADLIRFAKENVMDHAALMKMANGTRKPVGDDQRFVLKLPVGYRVVYSHEIQKGKEAKHLSVSYPGADGYPPVLAVAMIMEEFGFKRSLTHPESMVWQEPEVFAVNALEFV